MSPLNSQNSTDRIFRVRLLGLQAHPLCPGQGKGEAHFHYSFWSLDYRDAGWIILIGSTQESVTWMPKRTELGGRALVGTGQHPEVWKGLLQWGGIKTLLPHPSHARSGVQRPAFEFSPCSYSQ
jgi:hypothetical protein